VVQTNGTWLMTTTLWLIALLWKLEYLSFINIQVVCKKISAIKEINLISGSDKWLIADYSAEENKMPFFHQHPKKSI